MPRRRAVRKDIAPASHGAHTDPAPPFNPAIHIQKISLSVSTTALPTAPRAKANQESKPPPLPAAEPIAPVEVVSHPGRSAGSTPISAHPSTGTAFTSLSDPTSTPAATSDMIVCLKCKRVPSPDENPIVFCSRCERTWHKFCHIPAVPNEAIHREDVDWFCSRCTAVMSGAHPSPGGSVSQQNHRDHPNQAHLHQQLLTQKIGVTKPKTPGSPRVTIRIRRSLSSATPAITVSPAQLKPCRALTTEQKNAYFSSLSRDSLIELLMHAAETSPDLPLYNPNLPSAVNSLRYPETNQTFPGSATASEIPPQSLVRSSSTASPLSQSLSGTSSSSSKPLKGRSSSGFVPVSCSPADGCNAKNNHLPDPNIPALELDPQSYYPLPGAGLMRELIHSLGCRDGDWLVVDEDEAGAFYRHTGTAFVRSI